MRFVQIKNASLQDIQAVHRIRFQLIKWRTALANKVRGLLGEYGIVLAQGLAALRCRLPLILDDEENRELEKDRKRQYIGSSAFPVGRWQLQPSLRTMRQPWSAW
jgi:transposase